MRIDFIPKAKASAGSPPINKSLDSLELDFRMRVEDYLFEAESMGYKQDVLECARTHERQAWIYGQGRPGYAYNGIIYGRPGEIVTHAEPGHGNHEYRPSGKGRAVDVWPHGVSFKTEDTGRAMFIFNLLESTRRKHGLKNLPKISDFGHLEDL